jgi:hypothetical protein
MGFDHLLRIIDIGFNKRGVTVGTNKLCESDGSKYDSCHMDERLT